MEEKEEKFETSVLNIEFRGEKFKIGSNWESFSNGLLIFT